MSARRAPGALAAATAASLLAQAARRPRTAAPPSLPLRAASPGPAGARPPCRDVRRAVWGVVVHSLDRRPAPVRAQPADAARAGLHGQARERRSRRPRPWAGTTASRPRCAPPAPIVDGVHHRRPARRRLRRSDAGGSRGRQPAGLGGRAEGGRPEADRRTHHRRRRRHRRAAARRRRGPGTTSATPRARSSARSTPTENRMTVTVAPGAARRPAGRRCRWKTSRRTGRS